MEQSAQHGTKKMRVLYKFPFKPKTTCVLSFILLFYMQSCGGGLKTKNHNEDLSVSYGNAEIKQDAFILGSDYPSDIEIPDIKGMESTAFIVSFSSPSGVVAVDIDSSPIKISSEYSGVVSPPGTGYPNVVHLLSGERGFLLTSTHIVDFNPKSGTINTSVNLIEKITLDGVYKTSDGASITSLEMNYPADVVSAGNKLYVSMSNLISPMNPATAAPGSVRIFEITGSSPYLIDSGYVLTNDYNPTGLTKISNSEIAVTNSGLSDIFDGAAHPITNSSIDILDTASGKIDANIPIGKASLSYKKMAVTSNGSRGFIGSSSFGEIYEVDFDNLQPVYDRDDPIVITGNDEGGDYMSSIALNHDDSLIFVASFDNSAIYTVDISFDPPVVLPDLFNEPFILGFPKGATNENPTGENTGVGDITVRPGVPGVDFDGSDIFALTGSPGKIATVKTYSTEETKNFSATKVIGSILK